MSGLAIAGTLILELILLPFAIRERMQVQAAPTTTKRRAKWNGR